MSVTGWEFWALLCGGAADWPLALVLDLGVQSRTLLSLHPLREKEPSLKCFICVFTWCCVQDEGSGDRSKDFCSHTPLAPPGPGVH